MNHQARGILRCVGYCQVSPGIMKMQDLAHRLQIGQQITKYLTGLMAVFAAGFATGALPTKLCMSAGLVLIGAMHLVIQYAPNGMLRNLFSYEGLLPIPTKTFASRFVADQLSDPLTGPGCTILSAFGTAIKNNATDTHTVPLSAGGAESGVESEESTDPTDHSFASVAMPSAVMGGRASKLKGWQKVIDLNSTFISKFKELKDLNQELVESFPKDRTDYVDLSFWEMIPHHSLWEIISGIKKFPKKEDIERLQDEIERLQMEIDSFVFGEQTDSTQAKLQQWKLSRQQEMDWIVTDCLDANCPSTAGLKKTLAQQVGQLEDQVSQLMASAFAKAKEEHGELRPCDLDFSSLGTQRTEIEGAQNRGITAAQLRRVQDFIQSHTIDEDGTLAWMDQAPAEYNQGRLTTAKINLYQVQL